ncbi:hypothetical protein DAI22_03g219501 [Oryza sativa Japonica Group]|nr:hypothetical protein DAI22_03g219501 [Oryza sativa Japonica Group]
MDRVTGRRRPADTHVLVRFVSLSREPCELALYTVALRGDVPSSRWLGLE